MKFSGFARLGNQQKRGCLEQAYDTFNLCLGKWPPIPPLSKLIIYNFEEHFLVHINRGVIRGSKGGAYGGYAGIGARRNEGRDAWVSSEEVGILKSKRPL